MEMVKLMIVDDQQIVRDGLKALLSFEDYIEISSEASNGDELLSKLKYSVPDILLLDIDLPGKSGLELLKIVKSLYPSVKVIMLSMYVEEKYIFEALKNGAMGYIPKNSSKDVLYKAIRTVNEGYEFFDEKTSKIIMNSYVKKAQRKEENENDKTKLLTQHEMKILKMIAEGMTNQEIAEKLFISIRTVESHKNHIMQKLKFKSCPELVKFAIKNHIIEL